jgi:glutaredoxin-like protein NrdH
MGVIVYTKPACVQCNATYRALDKKGIKYSSVDITVDADALDRLKALGHMQAPVVEVVGDDGGLVDDWTGFRPDKIEELAQELSQSGSLV